VAGGPTNGRRSRGKQGLRWAKERCFGRDGQLFALQFIFPNV
jgi:hypothetical protein